MLSSTKTPALVSLFKHDTIAHYETKAQHRADIIKRVIRRRNQIGGLANFVSHCRFVFTFLTGSQAGSTKADNADNLDKLDKLIKPNKLDKLSNLDKLSKLDKPIITRQSA